MKKCNYFDIKCFFGFFGVGFYIGGLCLVIVNVKLDI